MKLFYLTDTHDMGRNPGARTDDYHSAIMRKMTEAVDAAIAKNVDAFIHGGDWFMHPKVSNIIYNQHQRLLRKLKRNGIPVYVVPGNHDLFGYSMSTIEQTSLGGFKNAGLVTLLTRDNPIVLIKGKQEVGIYGREYSVDIDHDPLTDYEIDKQPNTLVDILFSHGMLLKKPFHPDVRHTLTKDVITQAHHVFNGHYHPGVPSHVENGTEYHNIGSTARDEGTVANMSKRPVYGIIDINKKGVVKLTTHEYKCAPNGADIFDRTQLVQNKQHTKHLEAFEQTIHDALAFDAFNPKDILLQTKANKNLPQSILDETLAAIVEQEQLIQDTKLDGFVAERKPVWIDKVEIVNFESHKNTVVELGPKGLNAITGPSDSGKSSIFRAIYFAIQNEPKGAEFIRKGAKRTTVKVHMSNGKIIERSRTKTSAGEYILHDGAGKPQEFKGFGNAIPIEILNAHQMPKVELSTGVERSLNIARQLDGHFMLSESAGSRASAIGRLTGVHLVDAAIREKTKEIRAVTIETNGAEKRIEELKADLTEYEFVDAEEKKLKSIQGLMISAERTEKKVDRLVTLQEDRLQARNDVVKFDVEVGALAYLDGIETMIQSADKISGDIDRLTSLVTSHTAVTNEITEASKTLASINLSGVEEKLEKATQLMTDIRELEALVDEYNDIEREIKALEASIGTFDAVAIEASIKKAEELIAETDRLNSLDERHLDAVREFAEAQNKLDIASTQLEGIEQKMDELLDELDNTCPLCSQEISDVSVLTHSH